MFQSRKKTQMENYRYM